MRIVLQRTKEALVKVNQEIVGKIDFGCTLFVGITHEDTLEDVDYLAKKIVHLRIFDDENGKMNRSLLDVGGQVLSISQFTLYGDCRKGRRPNFIAAAEPTYAKTLYDAFNERLRAHGVDVQTGQFGAKMEVELVNDGPVTFILESE